MGDLSMRDSGGKEKNYSSQSAALPESIHKKKHGMAKVIRDEEGNIVSVEEPQKVSTETAWGPALNDDDEEDDSDGLENDDEEAKEPPKKDVTQCE